MNKEESYHWAAKRVRAQVTRHVDVVATLANTAAILKEYRPDFFWVGFYLLKEDDLVLGPFQGPPACVKLRLEKGVCAACARSAEAVIVPDVDSFPGHIACDERSKSEIAIPVLDGEGLVRAVLDVDSEKRDDFDETDRRGLEVIAKLLKKIWDVPKNAV